MRSGDGTYRDRKWIVEQLRIVLAWRPDPVILVE
jgi:hypothetical protein